MEKEGVMSTRMKMNLMAVLVALGELAWCAYALVIRPLLPDSVVKAVREFKLKFEMCLAFLIVVALLFELAALSAVFYLVFFHEWTLSVVIAVVAMGAMYGFFYWQDERHAQEERRWAEKRTAPPAPS